MNKKQLKVIVEGRLHPVVSTRRGSRLEPGTMIDGYNSPEPSEHLLMKIAAVIGNVSLTNTADEGGGHTELDSHANMCVLGRQCCILS